MPSFLCCDYDIGDHMPATCQQIEMWLQKASDESENVKWLLGNTKKYGECNVLLANLVDAPIAEHLLKRTGVVCT